jgi:predicted acetyltransferase
VKRVEMINVIKNMPIPPSIILGETVGLKFIKIVPGDTKKDYVPYYHFEINQANDVKVGHINFRIGETDHLKYCAGHIGFEILKEFRGHSYSYFACVTLKPFIKSIYNSVLITTNPQNLPSMRTIEKLGCEFIDEIDISLNEEAYLKGERTKRRYRWYP